jgi:hypothetical protein
VEEQLGKGNDRRARGAMAAQRKAGSEQRNDSDRGGESNGAAGPLASKHVKLLRVSARLGRARPARESAQRIGRPAGPQ